MALGVGVGQRLVLAADLDLAALWCLLLDLGQSQFQHAVLERGLHGLRVHAFGQRQGAVEAAIARLRARAGLVLGLVAALLLATDRDLSVSHVDADIVPLHAGQFQRQAVFALALVVVDGRREEGSVVLAVLAVRVDQRLRAVEHVRHLALHVVEDRIAARRRGIARARRCAAVAVDDGVVAHGMSPLIAGTAPRHGRGRCNGRLRGRVSRPTDF